MKTLNLELDLTGSLLASGLFVAGSALKVDVTIAIIGAVLASVVWVHVQTWLNKKLMRDELQRRINQL